MVSYYSLAHSTHSLDVSQKFRLHPKIQDSLSPLASNHSISCTLLIRTDIRPKYPRYHATVGNASRLATPQCQHRYTMLYRNSGAGPHTLTPRIAQSQSIVIISRRASHPRVPFPSAASLLLPFPRDVRKLTHNLM